MKKNPTTPKPPTKTKRQHPAGAGSWSKTAISAKTAVVVATGAVVTGLGVVAPAKGPTPGSLDTLANGCSMTGNATPKQWEFSANMLKNRWEMPSADDNFNGDATIAVLASAPSDPKPSSPNSAPDSKVGKNEQGKAVTISEDQTAEIDGYIAYVKPGGVESCNCKSQDPQYMDTHIYVSPNLEHANQHDKQFCVIVEVTPRVRIEQVQSGHDWSTSTLVSTLKPGTHVHISGYLFDDQEHRPNSLIDSPNGSNIWRASCWEIHPVTDIQIVGPSASSGGSK
ncbi:MAG: hypothetical protein JST51_05805 [Armatimonadetes bacterium]|nr:hypothetical protein [Armatimonadota bacterium]